MVGLGDHIMGFFRLFFLLILFFFGYFWSQFNVAFVFFSWPRIVYLAMCFLSIFFLSSIEGIPGNT